MLNSSYKGQHILNIYSHTSGVTRNLLYFILVLVTSSNQQHSHLFKYGYFQFKKPINLPGLGVWYFVPFKVFSELVTSLRLQLDFYKSLCHHLVILTLYIYRRKSYHSIPSSLLLFRLAPLCQTWTRKVYVHFMVSSL